MDTDGDGDGNFDVRNLANDDDNEREKLTSTLEVPHLVKHLWESCRQRSAANARLRVSQSVPERQRAQASIRARRR